MFARVQEVSNTIPQLPDLTRHLPANYSDIEEIVEGLVWVIILERNPQVCFHKLHDTGCCTKASCAKCRARTAAEYLLRSKPCVHLARLSRS
jgi:hypothetical protein